LRLRGITLAVVTLGLAAAADLTLTQIQFPGATEGLSVERPFFDDRSYFLFGVVVLVVCGLGVYHLRRGRWGSAWQMVVLRNLGDVSFWHRSGRTATPGQDRPRRAADLDVILSDTCDMLPP
ncbi:hypothetical protein ACFQ1S_45235, partial [Kibdelosporangium lantanae]